MNRVSVSHGNGQWGHSGPLLEPTAAAGSGSGHR